MSFSYPAVDQVVDAYIPMQLWLPGGHKPVFIPYVIKGGQTLLRGSVLGLITATHKVVLAVAAAVDGSQIPFAILPEDIASFASDGVTALDMSASIAVRGHVNVTALTFGLGRTWLNSQGILNNLGVTGRYMGYSG